MFVVCGEALFDLFGTETPDGLGFDARIGGSPFNVAVALARLGQQSALFTGVSTDPLGERLAAALEAEGVRTDLLRRRDRPTTLSVVNVAANGHPHYTFYGSDAADRAVTQADLPALRPDAWGVHAGSYSLVVEPVGSALLALFGREAGKRLLTLDPNVRLNVEPDTAVWRDRIARFVALADLVKVSDEDLGLLYGGTDTAEIAAQWLDAGAAIVVVTRGPEGAEVFRRGGTRHAVGGIAVEVRDTVGAGDTFQAALIAGLAELGIRSRRGLEEIGEDSLQGLLRFAVRAAAITCTRRGADLPRRSELPAQIG